MSNRKPNRRGLIIEHPHPLFPMVTDIDSVASKSEGEGDDDVSDQGFLPQSPPLSESDGGEHEHHGGTTIVADSDALSVWIHAFYQHAAQVHAEKVDAGYQYDYTTKGIWL